MQRKQTLAKGKKPKPAKPGKLAPPDVVEDDNKAKELVRERDNAFKENFVKIAVIGLSILFVLRAPLPDVDVLKPQDSSTSFLSLYLHGKLDRVEHITQMLIAAVFSLFLDVFVVYFHVTNPPHPKFVMVPSRKFSIFTHLISGITEIVSATIAFTVGDPVIQKICATLMSLASITHALTAYYQTGVVFGAKGVMVPGYLYAITIHITNAFRLFHNPLSVVHLLFTFLMLHIYVWCRFFIAFFRICKAFTGYHYTVSISFSGMLLFPYAMGPIGNYGMLAVCTVYCTLEALLSGKTGADLNRKLFAEHERYALTTRQSVTEWKSALHGSQKQDSDEKMARDVFDRHDIDKSGHLSVVELHQMVSSLGIPDLTVSKMLYTADTDHDDSVSFEEFYRYIWNFSTVKHRLVKLPKDSKAELTDKAKARIVFDMLDMDKSGSLGLAELEILLTQWGMPDSEAESYLSIYSKDNKKGNISFDVFFKQMKPIWNFAIDQVYT